MAHSKNTRSLVQLVPPKSGSFMPDRILTSLSWAESFASAASTSLNVFNMQANAVNDPGLAAYTTQPVGYDSLGTLYNRCRVHASTVEIIISLTSSSTTPTATACGGRAVLCWTHSGGSGVGSFTALRDMRAQKFSKFGCFTLDKPLKLKMTLPVAKHAINMSADRLQAFIDNAPADLFVWRFGYLCDVNYTGINTQIEFKVTYEVEFFELAQLPLSTLLVAANRRAIADRIKAVQETKHDFTNHGFRNDPGLQEQKEEKGDEPNLDGYAIVVQPVEPTRDTVADKLPPLRELAVPVLKRSVQMANLLKRV